MNRNAKRTSYLFALVMMAVSALVGQREARATTIGEPTLLTVDGSGESGNGSSFFAYLTPDGQIAAFESWATNWASSNYANTWTDIFLKNRVSGEIRQITKSYAGGATDEDSFDPVLSADGRYVAFFSYATNLVPDDTNRDEWTRNGLDLFVYDTLIDHLERVSLTSNDEEIDGNSVGTITPDGKITLIISDGNGVLPGDDNSDRRSAVYWREWQTGAMERITGGIDGRFPDGMFVHVWGSYDGSRVAFSTDSSNLVPGDENGLLDIFLYERSSGTVKRISVAADGTEANGASGQPQITSDGRYVVFRSHASNLVRGDNNSVSDIFRYDAESGAIERVSVDPGGVEGNGQSKDPSICDNSRLIAYTSDATNLVAGDTNATSDVFLLDMVTGAVELVSDVRDGEPGNGKAHRSFLAAECDTIAFASEASNLVAGDLNGERDIFTNEIDLPLSLTAALAVAPVTPGGVELPIALRLANGGIQALNLTVAYELPGGTIYVPGSASDGATYDAGTVRWAGEISPGESGTIELAIAIPGEPSIAYPITHRVQISGDLTSSLSATTFVNGRTLFLPIARYQD